MLTLRASARRRAEWATALAVVSGCDLHSTSLQIVAACNISSLLEQPLIALVNVSLYLKPVLKLHARRSIGFCTLKARMRLGQTAGKAEASQEASSHHFRVLVWERTFILTTIHPCKICHEAPLPKPASWNDNQRKEARSSVSVRMDGLQQRVHQEVTRERNRLFQRLEARENLVMDM